uniref:ATP synthase subunit a n=1 Tax=Pyura gangelion TaxID=569434 RepID=S0DG84_PYUGA|nr:ATP synthase F0 subunit 6 [Pyura gangelion]CCO25762.1 ATPase subunit 6 [Pyura gangelion]
MFSLFESSFFLTIPIGMLILISVVLFLTQNKGNGYFELISVGVLSHYSKMLYPGLYLIILMLVSILIFNLFGLVPMSFSFTSLPMVTLGFGVIFWLGGYIYCLFVNYSGCVSHFLPLGSPSVLAVVLVWIEIISWLCRPLALGVRLMANITAGHLLLVLISGGLFFLKMVGAILGVVLLALVFLEIAVACIQGYVYSLLLSLYMSEGLE